MAIALVASVAALGLVIDWGYTFWTAMQLQTAADAAALSGAQWVYYGPDQARLAAIDRANDNFAGDSDVTLLDNPTNAMTGDVVAGLYDPVTRTFTPATGDEEVGELNAVQVHARRIPGAADGPLPLFFGPIFGDLSADVERFAIACAEGGPAYSDVIALNAHDPMSFYVYGSAYLNVGDSEGSVQVNSDNTTNNQGGSLIQGTQVEFLAGRLNVVGMQYERGRPSIPDTYEFQPYIPDPLAHLPEPEVPGSATYPATPEITGDGEFWPGYYPGGIDLQDDDTIFLHPGVYILDTGFYTNGHSTLEAYGVMFYLNEGSVHDNGTGQVYCTPPTEGVYKDIQFFQARDNTEMAQFNGGTLWTGSQTDDPSTPEVNESTIGTGTLYFPNAKLECGGTGDMYVNGLIADKIVVYGTGHKWVTGGYDSNKGNQQVYLVE
jgi:hypothetical protein